MKPILLNSTKWYLTLVGAACIAASGITSCSDNDVLRDPAAGRTASFVPLLSESAGTRAADDTPLTRAAGGSWDAGDQVGIYMVPHVAQATDPADLNSDYAATSSNVPYQVSEGGESVSLQVLTGTGPIVYPLDESQVNFVAYYPYQSNTHTTNNNIYKVNVGTQWPTKDIDLCYHKGTGTAYAQGSSAVSLPFGHQLSKMKLSLISMTTDLSEATLTLTGFPTTANFDLATGTFNTLGATSVVLAPVKDATLSSEECAAFEALLVPHEADAGYTRVITFTLGDKIHSYTLTDDKAFLSGKSHKYGFKLTGAGIEPVLEGNLADWSAGTPRDPDGLVADLGDPLLLAGNANCIMVPSNNKQGVADGFAFDIAPQLTKYGTYKATGSLKAADVDSKNATQVIADGAAWTAKVIWQTAPNLITLAGKTGTGPTGNIRFTLPEADIQGNALVAVEVGGDIVWSWHLWVLNHDPGTTTYVPNNTDVLAEDKGKAYTFLNYNLGATTNTLGLAASYGLYYQWGRKDPFTNVGAMGSAATGYYKGDGTAYTNPTLSSGSSTDYALNLAASVKSPDTFITTNWCGSTATGSSGATGNISWGGHDGGSEYQTDKLRSYLTDKTVFDPCPAGYRVPPVAAFGRELSSNARGFYAGFNWTTITGGYNSSTVGPGIFPAGGYRVNSTGALSGQGTLGYFWSASLNNDTSGYYLNLSSGDANPRNTTNRAYGSGVRCVCL